MDRLFFSDRRVSTVEKPGKSPFSFSLSLSLSLSVFRLSLSYFVFLFLPLFPFLSFLIPPNSHVLHVCSSLIFPSHFPFLFSSHSLLFLFLFLFSFLLSFYLILIHPPNLSKSVGNFSPLSSMPHVITLFFFLILFFPLITSCKRMAQCEPFIPSEPHVSCHVSVPWGAI